MSIDWKNTFTKTRFEEEIEESNRRINELERRIVDAERIYESAKRQYEALMKRVVKDSDRENYTEFQKQFYEKVVVPFERERKFRYEQ